MEVVRTCRLIPFLVVELRARLDGALSNLIWW